MLVIDVNVLIYAHRKETPLHGEFLDWIESTLSSKRPFSIPGLVRSGFLRIVTNPRIYSRPTPMQEALEVLSNLLVQPNHVEAEPGDRHWPIFLEICREAGVKGNLVPDAYLAALAIEKGAEFITVDRDYARFPGLRWRHPLEDDASGEPSSLVREKGRLYRVAGVGGKKLKKK
jgi:toxin-antitoxin system PIN domain toxin